MKDNIDTVSVKRITWKYLSLILFLILAGIALATGLAVHFIHKDEIVHESFQRDVLSKDFGELVNFYRNVASNLSRKHELRDILEFSDIDQAELWARNTRSLLSEAIGVALIDRDGQVLGEPLQLRLGNQCLLDLKHMLSDKQISQPPVHNDVPRLAHFDIIQPVSVNGETIGLLFMSFSLDVLQHRAEQLVAEGQYLLIEDVQGRKLAQVGELPEVNDEHLDHVRVTIVDTDWHMHYIARHDETSQLFVIAVLIGVVILAITTLVTFILSGRLVRLLQNDFNLIRSKLESVTSGSVDIDVNEGRVLLETAVIMEDVSLIVEQIKQLSMYDSLTGLLNRRVFEDEIERHLELVSRGFLFRLVLLDLDHFKQVNDAYGHDVGDEVLVVLADSLRERCRSTDVLARLGGDEFALIMPGEISTSLDDFYTDLNTLFVSKQALINNGQGIESPCQISAGAVSIGREADYDIKQLMKQADQLLYEAKRAGRATIRYSSSH
ncbi:MAG: GGDEF domain-containing protein [Gammaproteobacteria bacterium]|nr:GGDEF domain-containing protein [Gammaproteobacteria bacterium]MCW8910675.1 GGDEF domain-containing protein [Gammaproteobacteria bacterium]MCW9005816.1 GGDEF domain-containing protein [Gammaproteobacteria bacterium]MCW9057072.1 GGDEF domain-containing protein [Gammaproteobacteria bacterium]